MWLRGCVTKEQPRDSGKRRRGPPTTSRLEPTHRVALSGAPPPSAERGPRASGSRAHGGLVVQRRGEGGWGPPTMPPVGRRERARDGSRRCQLIVAVRRRRGPCGMPSAAAAAGTGTSAWSSSSGGAYVQPFVGDWLVFVDSMMARIGTCLSFGMQTSKCIRKKKSKCKQILVWNWISSRKLKPAGVFVKFADMTWKR